MRCRCDKKARVTGATRPITAMRNGKRKTSRMIFHQKGDSHWWHWEDQLWSLKRTGQRSG